MMHVIFEDIECSGCSTKFPPPGLRFYIAVEKESALQPNETDTMIFVHHEANRELEPHEGRNYRDGSSKSERDRRSGGV